MLLVAYDGSAFHGFASQPNEGLDTVGGALSGALARMTGAPVAVTCAGRTDAGVHATGQVVHADLPCAVLDRWLSNEPTGDGHELTRLAKSLTAQLGGAVVVGRARLARDGFDARHSAIARRYRYRILEAPAPEPLERLASWHVAGPLDIAALRIGADGLLGEHDFAAFCRRPPGHDGPLTRRVTDVRWGRRPARSGMWLSFEIEANAFCHRMVRSIVGTLVAVGQGRLPAAEVLAILRSGDRAAGGRLAPACGLSLELVRYPDELVPGGVFVPR